MFRIFEISEIYDFRDIREHSSFYYSVENFEGAMHILYFSLIVHIYPHLVFNILGLQSRFSSVVINPQSWQTYSFASLVIAFGSHKCPSLVVSSLHVLHIHFLFSFLCFILPLLKTQQQ